MKCTVVFMDNGESYEDNQNAPVVVCENEETAELYIHTHPIDDESFREVFHYKFHGRGKYFYENVKIFTGK